MLELCVGFLLLEDLVVLVRVFLEGHFERAGPAGVPAPRVAPVAVRLHAEAARHSGHV